MPTLLSALRKIYPVDTDPTLAADSDTLVASQRATKAAIATAITGLETLVGDINCSANPNYPVATKGQGWRVSAAGKIGGASGRSVQVDDVIIAMASNAGGTQAAVGASWTISQGNLVAGVDYATPEAVALKLDRAITPKSAAFNAAAGGQYAPDTTAAAFAGTLPAAPSVGERIYFQDPQGTWNTNNFTVARNGKKIGGVVDNLVCDVNNSALWLEYVGGATEWQVFRNS